MKKIFRLFQNRLFFYAVLFLLEIAASVFLFRYLSFVLADRRIVFVLMSIFRILLLFYLLFIREVDYAFKSIWIMLIVLQPILGVIFYVFLAGRKPSPRYRRKFYQSIKNDVAIRLSCPGGSDLQSKNLMSYICNNYGQPLYENAGMELHIPCDDADIRIAEKIKNAKRYVFMEMFIISSGAFLSRILKAFDERRDLEIYIIADSLGSLSSISRRDFKMMKETGVHFAWFNKVGFIFSSTMNFRNHRKMIVVDGETAFTGGMNIADEYVNLKKRCGYWLDSLACIEGDVVSAFVDNFITDWHFVTGEQLERGKYLANTGFAGGCPAQFFSCNPILPDMSAGNILLALVKSALKRIYITTPYLVPDSSLEAALKMAAKSGLDVRIVIPGVPDKHLTYLVTQDYAGRLAACGIKMLVYKKGFIHSKLMLIDDCISSVSTVNTDYRSIFLNFECGTVFYGKAPAEHISESFDSIFAQSEQFCLPKKGPLGRLFVRIIKVFSSFL